jgi:hypothetical protein
MREWRGNLSTRRTGFRPVDAYRDPTATPCLCVQLAHERRYLEVQDGHWPSRLGHYFRRASENTFLLMSVTAATWFASEWVGDIIPESTCSRVDRDEGTR